MALTFDLSSAAAFKNIVETIRSRSINMRPFFNSAGNILRNSTLYNFEVGGRPTRWVPSLRAIRENGQTLVDTGLMRGSIHLKATNDYAKTSISGAAQKYAHKHQYGVGNMYRRFMLLQTEDEVRINKELMDYLTGSIFT